jgi:hypothetical protein
MKSSITIPVLTHPSSLIEVGHENPVRFFTPAGNHVAQGVNLDGETEFFHVGFDDPRNPTFPAGGTENSTQVL